MCVTGETVSVVFVADVTNQFSQQTRCLYIVYIRHAKIEDYVINIG